MNFRNSDCLCISLNFKNCFKSNATTLKQIKTIMFFFSKFLVLHSIQKERANTSFQNSNIPMTKISSCFLLKHRQILSFRWLFVYLWMINFLSSVFDVLENWQVLFPLLSVKFAGIFTAVLERESCICCQHL